mgnify:FL=1
MNRSAALSGLSSLEILLGLSLGALLLTPLIQTATLQWTGQRQWASDLKLQQSLSTVTDSLARELRRAGSWGWADRAAPGSLNPYSGLQLSEITTGANAADSLVYAYAHPKRTEDGVLSDDERWGWRLRNGVVEAQLGLGNWQAVSDPQRVRITRFKLSVQTESVPLPCALTCSNTSSPCPPVQMMRTVWIDLAGQAPQAASTGPQRTLKTAVQLRNHTVVGSCRD